MLGAGGGGQGERTVREEDELAGRARELEQLVVEVCPDADVVSSRCRREQPGEQPMKRRSAGLALEPQLEVRKRPRSRSSSCGSSRPSWLKSRIRMSTHENWRSAVVAMASAICSSTASSYALRLGWKQGCPCPGHVPDRPPRRSGAVSEPHGGPGRCLGHGEGLCRRAGWPRLSGRCVCNTAEHGQLRRGRGEDREPVPCPETGGRPRRREPQQGGK